MCMETNQLQDLPTYGQKVAGQYMALEREARRYNPEGKILHIVPKFHMFQHNGHEVGLHKARTKSHPAKFHTSFVPHVHKNMTECGQVEKQKQPKIDVF